MAVGREALRRCRVGAVPDWERRGCGLWALGNQCVGRGCSAGGMAVSVTDLSKYDQGTALASNEFLASLGVKHAVGALGHKRRGAVHEDHTMAPSRDLPEKLREFERRRGVNHMQIFLEKLVAEILEQNGANHSVKKLIRVRELLADIIAQVQKLAQGSKGRDARELMRLREKFIMLSHADREANLPPEFRAGSVIDGQEVPGLVRRTPASLADVSSVQLFDSVRVSSRPLLTGWLAPAVCVVASRFSDTQVKAA